jgi:hypothetical protein
MADGDTKVPSLGCLTCSDKKAQEARLIRQNNNNP